MLLAISVILIPGIFGLIRDMHNTKFESMPTNRTSLACGATHPQKRKTLAMQPRCPLTTGPVVITTLDIRDYINTLSALLTPYPPPAGKGQAACVWCGVVAEEGCVCAVRRQLSPEVVETYILSVELDQYGARRRMSWMTRKVGVRKTMIVFMIAVVFVFFFTFFLVCVCVCFCFLAHG
mmetsp:Transcript_53831/g.87138  ORF Transcript_53831/g.87138 Transcript_53831/m.87138 type:complete len:179 (-) Transcript_53831:457-993(-)